MLSIHCVSRLHTFTRAAAPRSSVPPPLPSWHWRRVGLDLQTNAKQFHPMSRHSMRSKIVGLVALALTLTLGSSTAASASASMLGRERRTSAGGLFFSEFEFDVRLCISCTACLTWQWHPPTSSIVLCVVPCFSALLHVQRRASTASTHTALRMHCTPPAQTGWVWGGAHRCHASLCHTAWGEA